VKVLIVDDEQLARDRLARMLADMDGYSVVGHAANGMQAVERCSELEPDIVLMDIRMPGMDGLEAARHIAGMDEPPAVVFCTA
jgi:two-component system response regulator AlgR